MRIAYILDSYPSLSETFLAREIAALRVRGIEITIFAIHAGDGATAIPIPPFLRATKIFPQTRTRVWKKIGAHWWNGLPNRQSIAHVHAGFASHPAALAWGAAEAANVSWSFSAHARDIWVEGDDLSEKLGAARFATSCTRAGVEALHAKNEQSEILYAPHGLELLKFPFQEREWRRGGVMKLLSVGRLVEKKGFAILLESLAQLRRENFLFAMTIIGQGSERSNLQRQIQQLRLGGCVRLAGALPNGETLAMMQRAHALVFAGVAARDGDRDGLPNVLLEAAALGTPIVATRAGSVTDFADENTAWLCAPNEAASLARAIAEVWRGGEIARNKAAAARARLEANFSVASNVEALATKFQSAIDTRESTPE